MPGIALIALTSPHLTGRLSYEYLRLGALVFRATTEAECYRQANRYFPTSIIFSDPLREGDAFTIFSWLRDRNLSITASAAIVGPRRPEQLARRFGLHPSQCFRSREQVAGFS
jgi:hypothetical protein